jgi:CelD/BcsL family acetyltransferase involved in cellulose biosynthesis
MSYVLTVESFDSLASCWANPSSRLKWSSIFVLPTWLKVWWKVFGSGDELYLRTLRQSDKIIGFAPLMINRETAYFLGSADVCDYLDFVIARGMERDFFGVLLGDLKAKGIKHLNLRPLRPDSTVLTDLVGTAQNRGYEVLCQPEDVSIEVDLPSTWEEYLAMLDKKQRHEVRRKLRRLWEVGNVEHHCLQLGQEVEDYMGTFLKLFSLSHDEKAHFMTAQMESFFRSLAKAMAEVGLLRFGVIELDAQPVAMTMGFDYDDSHYLYNSAYDPQFNYLSVGLLCKVLCLKESIEKGKKKWDFLKGDETYKYQLGGREVPLYKCHITIK